MRVRDEIDRLALAKTSAEQYQQILNEIGTLSGEELLAIRDDLNGLHSAESLPVRIVGGYAPQSYYDAARDEISTAWLPNNQGIEGLYSGYFIEEFDQPLAQGLGKLTVCHHVLFEEPATTSLDPYGSYTIKRRGAYVTALGAEVQIRGFMHAHDLLVLQDDPVVAEIDAICLNDDIPVKDKMLVLAQIFAGKTINRDTGYEQELDRQRVSYLNSLAVQEGLNIVSRRAFSLVGDGEVKLFRFKVDKEFTNFTRFELRHPVLTDGSTVTLQKDRKVLHAVTRFKDEDVFIEIK